MRAKGSLEILILIDVSFMELLGCDSGSAF
jgi:hypothetical protein